MPREIVTLSLERKSTGQSWGFRVVGGTDVELILQVDLVRKKLFLKCQERNHTFEMGGGG